MMWHLNLGFLKAPQQVFEVESVDDSTFKLQRIFPFVSVVVAQNCIIQYLYCNSVSSLVIFQHKKVMMCVLPSLQSGKLQSVKVCGFAFKYQTTSLSYIL